MKDERPEFPLLAYDENDPNIVWMKFIVGGFGLLCLLPIFFVIGTILIVEVPLIGLPAAIAFLRFFFRPFRTTEVP